MNSQHTPGPWHIGMKPGPILYGPKGEQVADLRDETLMPDERLANARLIAAAPDLLEALRDILKEHSGGALGNRLENNARSAIAKAERGQS